MLKFGKVTAISPLTARARVEFSEDNLTSYWLPVLQQKTNKDKYYSMVDVGENVACLMDENSEDGVILGAIYTDIDSIPVISHNQNVIRFEDGSFIEYNKDNQYLTICVKKIAIIADILQQGSFKNSNGIKSEANIEDRRSTMQKIRDLFNFHKHKDSQNELTSNPKETM